MTNEVRASEALTRPSSPELDAILGTPFPVLDDGHVRVIDYMGDDTSVVQAARVSYGKGTKTVSDDEKLLRHLMRERHTTPFEMCELKLHVRVPMDCWRQWIRHRTANVNEYSTRYSVAIDAKQQTEPEQWRAQSKDNKQGSGDNDLTAPAHWKKPIHAELDDHYVRGMLSAKEKDFQHLAHALYQDRLAAGVAREQARKDLPLSTYTEAYWKCDLHNLLHFLGLRMDSHAQFEIRQYANAIAEIVKVWVPQTWKAFEDFRLKASFLSGPELCVVRAVIRNETGLITLAVEGLSKREKKALQPKLDDMGFDIDILEGKS